MRSDKPMHGIGHELFDNHLFARPVAGQTIAKKKQSLFWRYSLNVTNDY